MASGLERLAGLKITVAERLIERRRRARAVSEETLLPKPDATPGEEMALRRPPEPGAIPVSEVEESDGEAQGTGSAPEPEAGVSGIEIAEALRQEPAVSQAEENADEAGIKEARERLAKAEARMQQTGTLKRLLGRAVKSESHQTIENELEKAKFEYRLEWAKFVEASVAKYKTEQERLLVARFRERDEALAESQAEESPAMRAAKQAGGWLKNSFKALDRKTKFGISYGLLAAGLGAGLFTPYLALGAFGLRRAFGGTSTAIGLHEALNQRASKKQRAEMEKSLSDGQRLGLGQVQDYLVRLESQALLDGGSLSDLRGDGLYQELLGKRDEILGRMEIGKEAGKPAQIQEQFVRDMLEQAFKTTSRELEARLRSLQVKKLGRNAAALSAGLIVGSGALGTLFGKTGIPQELREHWQEFSDKYTGPVKEYIGDLVASIKEKIAEVHGVTGRELAESEPPRPFVMPEPKAPSIVEAPPEMEPRAPEAEAPIPKLETRLEPLHAEEGPPEPLAGAKALKPFEMPPVPEPAPQGVAVLDEPPEMEGSGTKLVGEETVVEASSSAAGQEGAGIPVESLDEVQQNALARQPIAVDESGIEEPMPGEPAGRNLEPARGPKPEMPSSEIKAPSQALEERSLGAQTSPGPGSELERLKGEVLGETAKQPNLPKGVLVTENDAYGRVIYDHSTAKTLEVILGDKYQTYLNNVLGLAGKDLDQVQGKTLTQFRDALRKASPEFKLKYSSLGKLVLKALELNEAVVKDKTVQGFVLDFARGYN